MSPESRRDWRLYADDLLEACRKIRRAVAGLTLEAFKADEIRRDAVIRNIEIIGEAAKHIPDDVAARAAHIPWAAARPRCTCITSSTVPTAGGGELENMTATRAARHLHCLHQGWVSVRGLAPEALVWKLGIGLGGAEVLASIEVDPLPSRPDCTTLVCCRRYTRSAVA